MPKVLLGFMGAGKTTIGCLLDDHFLDMDMIIEERIGMSISDFFAHKGQAAFRELESALLAELMILDESYIVSTGGGVVISEANRQLLRQNRKHNILLSASFEVLYDRIKKDKNFQRPLFLNNSKEDFHGIFERRMTLYEGLSDLIINVDHRTPEEIVRIIKSI
ncbi:shikimate kinase [Streptococcus bovimastitidis]|uniref:Shikimate kinase n=1 Tax=Streptococcus bovimastitidis TaxID=1856638 RepID=A0A1L8MNB3_9STRE|nr:shikimate kinase [Streptococcus bovimastitidis]OJF72155.1 shikimate kinase [Streptococcus bovimastitidis]